jgi:hypothetical protein
MVFNTMNLDQLIVFKNLKFLYKWQLGLNEKIQKGVQI